MDELEWVKENSPSAKPSRDITTRHRTQLRAEIASEGADGTRPQRLRRGRRGRHRVFVTTVVVVALCAVGAGVVALTASGGDDGASTVGAPASSSAAPTTAPVRACVDAPPQTLAIPEGFGNPVAGPAKDALTAPLSTQQLTTWSSATTTIEQRWPADPDVAKRYGPVATSREDDGSASGAIEGRTTIEGNGVAHRLMLFTFAGRPLECSSLQVTVYGRDGGAVDAVVTTMSAAPFRITEPLVTTTAAALAAPDVVACEGVTRPDLVARAVPAVATVGGPVTAKVYAQPADALANFLLTQKTLARSGYAELRLPDASVTYLKEVVGKAVTTVHVTPTDAGWTVTDWQASGC